MLYRKKRKKKTSMKHVSLVCTVSVLRCLTYFALTKKENNNNKSLADISIKTNLAKYIIFCTRSGKVLLWD